MWLMADRILVRFHGEGAGIGELTWGQRSIWRAMQETNTSQSMGAVAPLPPGKTAADLAAELEFYLSRYESMRTRLRFDDEGRVTQVVFASGEIALHIVDTGGADPARVAAELSARWDATLFDYVDEWPIRMAAIRHRGVDTHVVVCVCHLASDGMGAAVMLAELAERDPATGRAARPITAMTPRQLAVAQATPGARRQSDLAVRYWERVMRTVAPRSGEPARRPGPRYRRVVLRSPAMYLAMRTIATRAGGDAAPVLLAAFAVSLARVTGSNPVVTRAIVSNRFRPGLSDVVSPINQGGLYVIDVAGVTFDEAVQRARRATFIGMKHAYYDPRQLQESIDGLGRERGVPIDLGSVYNDRRIQYRRLPDGPLPAEQQVRDALPDSVLRWDEPLPLFNEKLMININDVPDTVEVLALFDAYHVAPDDVETLLRGMEAVVVAAFAPMDRDVAIRT
jgi:condensation domain-containing protein